MEQYEGLILGTDSETVCDLEDCPTSNDSGLDQGENTRDSEKWSLLRVYFLGRTHRIWLWILYGA